MKKFILKKNEDIYIRSSNLKQHCSLLHFEVKNKVGLEQNLIQNETKSKKWSEVGDALSMYIYIWSI